MNFSFINSGWPLEYNIFTYKIGVHIVLIDIYIIFMFTVWYWISLTPPSLGKFLVVTEHNNFIRIVNKTCFCIQITNFVNNKKEILVILNFK